MAGRLDDDDQEKPLDPAVERVRRRLVRFVAINLGLLFVALMAVVVAIVYRANQASDPAPAEVTELPLPGDGTTIEDVVDLPTGSVVAGHSISGTRLSVLAEGPGVARQIVIYDLSERRVVARIRFRPGN